MPRFIVERTIPGAGDFPRPALQAIGRRSQQAASGMDVPYTGVETVAMGDTIRCIHWAETADGLARRLSDGGFPADRIVALDADAADAADCGLRRGVLGELGEEFGCRPSA